MTNLNINQLINAIRSQLYFSQITAWLASPDEKIRKSFPNNSVVYCLTIPGETYGSTKFSTNAQKHQFPLADIGNGIVLKVSLSNLPRTEEIPLIKCSKCNVPMSVQENVKMLDDRMQTSCTLKGKHRCEDFEDYENCCRNFKLKQLNCQKTNLTSENHNIPSTSKLFTGESSKMKLKEEKVDLELSNKEFNEVLNVLKKGTVKKNKGDILLDAILRSSKTSVYKCETKLASGIFLERNKRKSVHKLSSQSSNECVNEKMCDKLSCDKNFSVSDNNRISDNIYRETKCDTIKRKKTDLKMRDISNVFSLEYLEKRQKVKVKQKITFDEDKIEQNNNQEIVNEEKNKQTGIGIPTASDQAKFRKNLDSAASMVFHSRTGLPLTSSPAPVRRGKSCFDFDSSINSVSAIRRYLN